MDLHWNILEKIIIEEFSRIFFRIFRIYFTVHAFLCMGTIKMPQGILKNYLHGKNLVYIKFHQELFISHFRFLWVFLYRILFLLLVFKFILSYYFSTVKHTKTLYIYFTEDGIKGHKGNNERNLFIHGSIYFRCTVTWIITRHMFQLIQLLSSFSLGTNKL